MTQSRFYVTTPIYYVNAKPHIGHAYTTIVADVLSRYHRLAGVEVHFLTGTDEHGQKVQQAAAQRGVSPQHHADETVVAFRELWKTLEITNDDFIRTTEERHKQIVQNILQNLYDMGEIYKAEYDGWYCVTCERFFTERDVPERICPEAGCGRPVQRISESNYFFKMSQYKDWLVSYINDNPCFIQPDFRRNETLGFLRQKLNDLCISRPKSRMSWGIELPFDSEFVTYVWFDALINYISGIGYSVNPELFAKWWPASCQLVGKDILTTHTVYWPIMLKAMGVEMPKMIFAHGWWLSGGSRMSKSSGNVIDPMDFVERCGIDAFRYFLMAEMALGQDAAFTEDAFVRRYNADLANGLGNLLSRVATMIGRECGGIVPEPAAESEHEIALKESVLRASSAMQKGIEVMRIDTGVVAVSEAIAEANRYIEQRQPWRMSKDGDKAGLATVLYSVAETLRILSLLLSPIMPGKTAELRKALGIGGDHPHLKDSARWGLLKPGTRIGEKIALFPRLDEPKETRKPVDKTSVPESGQAAAKDIVQIEFNDFKQVDLRTAKVLTAERVEGADKLLRLEIEIGDEKRQIVAGIAKHYTPEQLVGRTIVVVANLKPARIRGVESNGMLLAATGNDGVLSLVSIDGEVGSGLRVG
jgi:methionyl-tRNA synthetase